VAEELVAVGAGPQVAAGVEDEVGPRAVGLQPVVSAAQGCDVAGAGRAAAGSGDDVVVVAGMLVGVVGVVGVAASGGSGAPGEHTGPVPDRDLFGDRAGDLVGVGVGAGGEVDDGFDDDLAVRAAAPGADLVDGDQRVPVFQPRHPISASEGGF